MKLKNLLLLGIVALLLSCSSNEAPPEVVALKPVYGTTDDILELIQTTEPQPLKSVGKIYTIGDLLFINEIGKGVHVIDNSDPKNPEKMKFIDIPGNVDIAIKGSDMYADMGAGLATIDISDLENIKKTHFDSHYVQDLQQHMPPQSLIELYSGAKVYYECPDKSKGTVISWTTETMPKPNCYINK